MSVCPQASHFSQTSAGISSRSRRGWRGFFSFLNQAISKENPSRAEAHPCRLGNGPLNYRVADESKNLAGSAAPLARDPHENADRKPARKHERSAIAEEWQRDARDRHEIDRHADVLENVDEPAREKAERNEAAER